MFILKKRHRMELAEYANMLAAAEDRIAALLSEKRELERAAHEFAEWGRYSLEAAAIVLGSSRKAESTDLEAIAHAMPYVWAGKRHWNDTPQDMFSAASALDAARAVCATHGFELPSNRREATVAIFQLAMALLVPGHSLPVERLRCRYPVEPGASDARSESRIERDSLMSVSQSGHG